MLKRQMKPTKKIDLAPKSKPKISYQSGFNAEGQAVNSGQVLGDYERNAFNPVQGLTDDGERGVQDLSRSMTDNSQAQMGRALESQNAQKNMQDQFVRSELTQQGLANQAQIYGDISQRAIDQMGLAAKLKEAQIRNKFSIANQRAMALRQNMLGGYGLGASSRIAGNLLKGLNS